VIDQDGDGKPGVSIRVPGAGKIFAALRVVLSLDARVASASSITGDAAITLDQAIYGDDIWFYDAAAAFAESQMFVMLRSATNTVKMSSNVSTCAGVRAAFP